MTCDWSDCFEKLENGEIDIMGGISYMEDRAEEMLFSDEPMGEENITSMPTFRAQISPL